MKHKILTLALSLALLAAAVLGTALLAGCSAPGGDGQDTQIIRVALNQNESHPEYIALADFGEKLKQATNGRYEVQIYPNAVLGDQGPVTEMIRTGALQLAVVPMSVPESYNGDLAIIAAPYLYDNLEQMETAAREGVFDPLFTTTSKYNFEIVSLYTSGARHIYTDRPVVTPEDLKGCKIRVQDSDAYIQMINLMGGIGIPMAQSEVYAAVQQHVIEGGENSEVVYNNFKHYEVSPYAECGVDILYIHPDSEAIPTETLALIRSLGKRPGIVLNPGVSLESVRELFPLVDYVLVMTVNPGFAGRDYLPYVENKIERLVALRRQYGFHIVIDGGVTWEILSRLWNKGGEGFVLGKQILFGQDRPYADIIRQVRALS